MLMYNILNAYSVNLLCKRLHRPPMMVGGRVSA